MTDIELERGRVPAECTLPTVEVPVRVAEFADALARARLAERPEPTRLLVTLRPAPGLAEAVFDLAARESACCSFFRFAIVEQDDGGVLLDITVPPGRVGVLDALASFAAGSRS